MVYNVHTKKDKATGVIKADQRGKHCKQQAKVSEDQKNHVMEHISSFPVLDSHYCRAKTNKKYLEADLNINKMYALYEEKCSKEKTECVKSSYYRYIFNTCFNFDFHVPKTDRYDKCEEVKMKKSEKIPISDVEMDTHNKHLAEKVAMREEKNRDKCITDDSCLLVVFDLENVITLHKAEAMTSSKQGYCAIWTELVSGRAGHDIASAFVKILTKMVEDHPTV